MKELKDNSVKCAECGRKGHPMQMVHLWMKTLCNKCANAKLLGVRRYR